MTAATRLPISRWQTAFACTPNSTLRSKPDVPIRFASTSPRSAIQSSGDTRYGGRLRLPPDPEPGLEHALRALNRHALHARELRFAQPSSGAEVEVSSPLPQDLALLIQALHRDLETRKR